MSKIPNLENFNFDPVDMIDEMEEVQLFIDAPSLVRSSGDTPPSVIVGDPVGSTGIYRKIHPQDIQKSLNMYMYKLDTFAVVDELLEVIITCSSYSRELKSAYRQAFLAVEKHLFENRTITQLRQGITSNSMSDQLVFHMLRAYAHAEEGNFKSADDIWHALYPDWSDIQMKRSHLLLHLFMSNLCMGRFDVALDFMRALWAAVKSMSGEERHDYAGWDDWTCCLLVSWFVAIHVKNFEVILKERLGVFSPYYLSQKKKLIIQHTNPKLIEELVSSAYYEKLRESFSSLPSLDI